MKTLHYGTQYKKDFKRYRNQPEKLQKLLEVLIMLENEEELPKELQSHKLAGQYRDCMECHIEGDFLLIWLDEYSDIIEILRLGSHSELFG
jgi:mRNA interferase YafQ